jgi:hypothetical protein
MGGAGYVRWDTMTNQRSEEWLRIAEIESNIEGGDFTKKREFDWKLE